MPGALLLLGVLYVAAACARLDGIYGDNPGVYGSWQVAPGPLSVLGLVSHPDTPAEPPPRSLDGDGSAGAPSPSDEDLELSARNFVAGPSADIDTPDVKAVSWHVGTDQTVAVAVALFSSKEAAAGALSAALAAKNDLSVGGSLAIAQTAWLAGNHLLVGAIVSAPQQAAAEAELKRTRRRVASYIGVARVVWFELLAVGPFALLYVAWVSARYVIFVLSFAVIAALGVVFIATIVPILLVAVITRMLTRRRSNPPHDSSAPLPPAPPEDVRVTHHEVEAPRVVFGLGDAGRSTFLDVVLIIAVGVGVLTTPLFPGSIVWGSIVLVTAAPSSAWAWARRLRYLAGPRKALLVLGVVALASVLVGSAPYGLLADSRIQALVISFGLVALVGQWRYLTSATTEVSAPWREDIDVRSTLLGVGTVALILGAGSLFLASNGTADVRSQLREKAIATPGILLAMAAAVNVRASRDAARRNRQRELGTPPVLYLRSFVDDRLTVRSFRMQRQGLERLSWRRRELFEDVVARALSRIGPVVGIAKPGTGQRDLGPARDSIITEDWLGAVKAYMGEAVLIAVVIGESEGLVRELEALGELGLLDRLCVIVPPVSRPDVGRRLEVLGRQQGYSNTWGALQQAPKSEILALTSIGNQRCVVHAPRRTALGYRRGIEDIAPAVRAAADRTK